MPEHVTPHTPDVVDELKRAQESWTLPVSEVKNYINIVFSYKPIVQINLIVSPRTAAFNLNLSVHDFLLSKNLCPLTGII